jgi:hypothetical protein
LSILLHGVALKKENLYFTYFFTGTFHLPKETEMGRACGTYKERRGAYRALVGKPEGRRPLGRPRRRWEDNIKMDLQEVRSGHGLDQSGPGLGQVAGSCEYGDKPSGSIKCGKFPQ